MMGPGGVMVMMVSIFYVEAMLVPFLDIKGETEVCFVLWENRHEFFISSTNR